MTEIPSDPIPLPPGEVPAGVVPSQLLAEPCGWLDRTRDWCAEHSSSILVKEARQALKSYQFLATYAILLACVLMWTAVVFAFSFSANEGVVVDRASEALFVGYFVILGLPLGVIVPFSAFRSLSREYEDGTIELISITTMKPYQVVIGKFLTAMMQMTIYLAVVAPCITLTYMLEGITSAQIALGLAIVIGGCVFLTIFGLLLAGASRIHSLGLAFSTLFVMGLGGLFLIWISIAGELIGNGIPFDLKDRQQLISMYAVIAVFGSIAGVMLAAGASQITFESDNRSTPVRLALLVQLLFFFALMVMVAYEFWSDPEVVCLGFMAFAGHYWLAIGSMLVGESGQVSERVRRSLPRGWIARSFWSLLMPGPGRGFLFSLACIGSCGLVTSLVALNADWLRRGMISSDTARFGGTPNGDEFLIGIWTSGMLCWYPAFFLACTYLLMTLLRRGRLGKARGAAGPLFGLVISGLLVFMFSVGSYAIWSYWQLSENIDYYSMGTLTTTGAFNWYMTIWYLGENGSGGDLESLILNSIEAVWFLTLAALVLLLAVAVACRELMDKPTAAPSRVVEEIQKEKRPVHSLPVGESLDEIFGVVEPPAGDSDDR